MVLTNCSPSPIGAVSQDSTPMIAIGASTGTIHRVLVTGVTGSGCAERVMVAHPSDLAHGATSGSATGC